MVACSGAYMGLTTRALPLGATLSRRAIVPVAGSASPASPASPASFGFKAYNKQALNMMLDKPSPEKQPKRAKVFSLKRTLATLEVKEAAYQKQLRVSPQKRKVTRPPVKKVLALLALILVPTTPGSIRPYPAMQAPLHRAQPFVSRGAPAAHLLLSHTGNLHPARAHPMAAQGGDLSGDLSGDPPSMY